ncbi:hypothetical protein AAAU22_02500 [[Clostridium] symbiosum]|uniref:hypothetical protein n=1 Tax=Clostridium symbiosum TaxID=1512 RepID=UPI0032C095D8
MNEKEFLDMMVTERIQILVQELRSAQTLAERKNTRLLMDQAEGILNRLSEQEHALMEQYLDSMTDRMTDVEPALYTGGFRDGIRVMKFINSL